MTRNRNRRVFIAVVAMVVVGAGSIFYACQKDGELKTVDSQVVKPVGDLYGHWGDWKEVSFNGVPLGQWNGFDPVEWQDKTCSRATYRERWYEDHLGNLHLERILVSISYYDCATGIITSTIYYTTGIAPHILNNSALLDNMDYTDITNFVFYVDGSPIDIDTSYEKDFEFEFEDEDGVHSITGIFHITYEHVVNLWNALQEQGLWSE